jgi:hypothetical protein
MINYIFQINYKIKHKPCEIIFYIFAIQLQLGFNPYVLSSRSQLTNYT